MNFALRARAGALALMIAATGSATACIAPTGDASATQDGETVATKSDGLTTMPESAPITLALSKLILAPEQRTAIEAVRSDLVAEGSAARAERKKLLELLADGLEKGSLDEAAIQAQVDRTRAVVDAAKPAREHAVQRLHDTLDAGQRQELADAMREAFKRPHHDGDKGSAEADAGQEKKGHHHKWGHDGRRRMLRELLGDLGLTDAQKQAFKDAIKAAKAKAGVAAMGAAAREQARRVGEAFVASSFDAKAVDAGALGGRAIRKWTGRIVRFVEVANGILTPEQRAQLAGKLRARAART